MPQKRERKGSGSASDRRLIDSPEVFEAMIASGDTKGAIWR
jgi:hypothetical protein